MKIFKIFNKNFICIFLSILISKFGDSIHYIAFNYYLYEKTKSALIVSNSLIFALIPTIFLGPYIGTIVDKYSKKSLMIFSDITRFLLVLGIIFFSKFIVVLFLIQLFIGILDQLYSVSNKAIIGLVLDDTNRIQGNGLLSSTKSCLKIIGPAVAGCLVAIFNIKLVFLINALTFIVSAFFNTLLHISDVIINSKPAEKVSENSIKIYLASAFHLFENRDIFTMWISNNLLSIISAGNNVLLLVWISQVFPENSSAYGTLSSTLSIGLFIGALFATRYIRKHSSNIFNLYALLGSVVTVFFSFCTNFWFANSMRIVLGFSYSTTAIIMNTALQEKIIPKEYGKIFSFLDMFDYAITILFLWMFGILSKFYSSQLLIFTTGILSTVIMLLLMILSFKNSSRKQLSNNFKNNVG